MEKKVILLTLLMLISLNLFLVNQNANAEPSTLDCKLCHNDIYTKWKDSPHAMTQVDVATELGEERTMQTADEVLHGDDPEDCIACHSPTAVLTNGGMDETQAMNYFFTTTDSKYAEDTAADHTSDWPSVSCIACHDPHTPATPSLFESTTKEYVPMTDTSELCGQCHGNLRFPDTDHLSYNVLTGTGGVGVSDRKTMPDATCTDCHMYASDVDGANSAMYHGHSWAITVKEDNGHDSVSCTNCHSNMTLEVANNFIDEFRLRFETTYVITQTNVAATADLMKNVDDATLQNKLFDAQSNLAYAESDESSGFHNHEYLLSLLQNANSKALELRSTIYHQISTKLEKKVNSLELTNARNVELNMTVTHLNDEIATLKSTNASLPYMYGGIGLVIGLIIGVAGISLIKRKTS